MRNVLQWMKSNPVTVASAVVALLAIIFIFYIQSKGSQLEATMGKLGGTIDSISGYMSQSVQVPPEKPDDPPRTLQGVVINPQAISDLKQKYDKMSGQHDRLFQLATQINKRNHHLLAQHLFPLTHIAKIRYDARNAYTQAFSDMLSASGNPQLPHLNAGMPVSQQQLSQVVQQVDAQIHNENFNLQNQAAANNPNLRMNQGGAAQMSPSDIKRILQRKQAALIQAVQSHAQSISIYANTLALKGQAAQNRGQRDMYAPYTIQPWAFTGSKPTMAQLWEGQLELWIQQDVTAAIASVNTAGSEPSNPVKRLIHMQVVPGYIGLQTRGVVPIAQSQQQVEKAINSRQGRGTTINYYAAVSSGGRGGNAQDAAIGGTHSLQSFFGGRGSGSFGNKSNTGQLPDGTYPPPVSGQRTNNSNKAVPTDFYVSTTGRVSNAVYDVRQVKVSLIIDYSRLPQIINAISHTNFMTVLLCNIHEVNPHAALVSGYDYGQGDIVRADMVIETLWFRDWTANLMPQKVREYVGIDAPTDLLGAKGGGGGAAAPMPSGGAANTGAKPKYKTAGQ